MKLKVIFMGTPDFSVPTLDMLLNHHNIEIIGTVSMPSRPAGRGGKLKDPEVIEFSKKNHLKYWQTANINKDLELIKELHDLKIDVIIVLAFAQFLSQKVLALPRMGCFNIHTSLLPKYRGAAPIQYALLNGEKLTGVSIQKMVKKMDAGDIAASREVSISANTTGGELYTILKYQAALTAHKFIDDLISGNITYTTQDESQVSFAPILNKDDGFINFRESTAIQIFNQVRALKPWPGTYCYLGKQTMKIIDLGISDKNIRAGEVVLEDRKIFIGTKDQSIELINIQLPGKNIVDIKSFLNGFNGEIEINP